MLNVLQNITNVYDIGSPVELLLQFSDHSMNEFVSNTLLQYVNQNPDELNHVVRYSIDYCNGHVFHELLGNYNCSEITIMPYGTDVLEYLISYALGSHNYTTEYCNMIHDLLSHDYTVLDNHYTYLEKFNRKVYDSSILTYIANFTITDTRIENIDKIKKILDIFHQ